WPLNAAAKAAWDELPGPAAIGDDRLVGVCSSQLFLLMWSALPARVKKPVGSIALRCPVARAKGATGAAAPPATPRVAGELAGPRGVFVMNGDRRAHGAGSRHVSCEFYEIRMRDDAVGNIDGEVIAGVAGTSLRHEDEIPGSFIGRSRMCG